MSSFPSGEGVFVKVVIRAHKIFIFVYSDKQFSSLRGIIFVAKRIIFFFLKTNRPTTVALSSNSCLIIVRQLSDETEMGMGTIIS